MRVRCTVVLAAVCAATASLPAQSVPTPESYLGFQVGADRRLAYWPQIVGYLGTLAAVSPSVKLDTLGTTTLDRRDWGLTWNKALEAGNVLVGNDVNVRIDVEAGVPKEEAPAAQ